MSRARGPVETPEYAAFSRRMIRAYSRRVAVGDEPELAEMVGMLDTFEAAVVDAMAGYLAIDVGTPNSQRTRSWASIGRALGVSKQAAQQRWGERVKTRLAEISAA